MYLVLNRDSYNQLLDLRSGVFIWSFQRGNSIVILQYLVSRTTLCVYITSDVGIVAPFSQVSPIDGLIMLFLMKFQNIHPCIVLELHLSVTYFLEM